jgi:hypothetical protein
LALAGTSFSVQNLYQIPQGHTTYRPGSGWLCAIWQLATILCQWLYLSKESVGGKKKRPDRKYSTRFQRKGAKTQGKNSSLVGRKAASFPAPSARYICRISDKKNFKLRQERHLLNMPPLTGLWYLQVTFYKDPAPMALVIKVGDDVRSL